MPNSDAFGPTAMRYHEVLTEQALSRKDARTEAFALSSRINDHLVMLLSLKPSSNTNHWKSEVKGWLQSIARLKLKGKKNPPISADLYLEALWVWPFVPHAEESMNEILEYISAKKGKAQRNEKTTAQLVEELRSFHELMGGTIASRGSVDALVDEKIPDYVTKATKRKAVRG